jgi:hypothetical protein
MYVFALSDLEEARHAYGRMSESHRSLVPRSPNRRTLADAVQEAEVRPVRARRGASDGSRDSHRAAGLVGRPEHVGPDVPTEPEALFPVFARTAHFVAHELRSGGRTWEFVWVAEIGGGGTAHVHLLGWGDPVSGAKFRRAAIKAGMQWAGIERLRHAPSFSKYMLKAALSPLDDPVNGERHLAMHLALNGGRLVRSSRKFWRNGAEEPLSGLREARLVARKARPPGRRPTPAELAVWHTGWHMPPLAKRDEFDGTS